MINYSGQKIDFSGCPACAYAKQEFLLPCGMAYEIELFTVSQDWELPIQGFIVIAPKRHIENFSQLSQNERTQIFELTNKIINILKEHNVCEKFNVIFEEKENIHFHIWIMPRHKWMEDIGSITKNIGKIFDYAKANLRTEENFKEIKQISDIIKTELNN